MASGFPLFPRELFQAIREAGSEATKLRFVLVDGGALTATRIVQESDAGLLIDTDEGMTAAVPWHTILRVEVERPGGGKSVGFRRG